MKRLLSPTQFKLREKASVFLAELHPAGDAATRSERLITLRKRDFDATHHCVAWREGLPIQAWGSDDDGEPNGTAGAPMLRVLEGADLTDVLAVCIRWYGGTKLGTGGLVRAYTEALQGALAEAAQADLLEEVRAMRRGRLETEAALAHLPFAFLNAQPQAEVLEQGFEGAHSWVLFHIPVGEDSALEAAWRERSRGGLIHWESS